MNAASRCHRRERSSGMAAARSASPRRSWSLRVSRSTPVAAAPFAGVAEEMKADLLAAVAGRGLRGGARPAPQRPGVGAAATIPPPCPVSSALPPPAKARARPTSPPAAPALSVASTPPGPTHLRGAAACRRGSPAPSLQHLRVPARHRPRVEPAEVLPCGRTRPRARARRSPRGSGSS